MGDRYRVGLLAVGSVAYSYRLEIALGLVGVAMERRMNVGPEQEVQWSTGADPQGRAPSERPPNIVLILADDLGWNDLTFGGGGVADGSVPTPNIDSIAAEGVNFTNGYAANGTCAPSRAALMSGRYGTRFGFEFTPTPPGMMPARSAPPQPSRNFERLRENDRLRRMSRRRSVRGNGHAVQRDHPCGTARRSRLPHGAHRQVAYRTRRMGWPRSTRDSTESLLMSSGLYLPEDDPRRRELEAGLRSDRSLPLGCR